MLLHPSLLGCAEPSGFAAAADQPSGRRCYTTSQIAEALGLTVRAVRFYEKKGLVAPRRHGAVRIYSEGDRRRLAAIVRGKRLGFTLAEIRDMLDGAGMPELDLDRARCVAQIRHLEREKRNIEAALAELRQAYSGIYLREWTGE